MVLIGRYVENIAGTTYIHTFHKLSQCSLCKLQRVVSLYAHLVSLRELRGIRSLVCSLWRKLQPQQQPQHKPHTMTRSNPGGSFHQCLQRKILRNPIHQLSTSLLLQEFLSNSSQSLSSRTILLSSQRSYQDPYLYIRLNPSIRRLESTYQSNPDFIDSKTVFQRQTLQSIHQDARQDSL
jgi:hypothetical protein